jgi:hypothetical protein
MANHSASAKSTVTSASYVTLEVLSFKGNQQLPEASKVKSMLNIDLISSEFSHDH